MKNLALVGFGNWGKNVARVLDRLGCLRFVCDTDGGRLRAAHHAYPHAESVKSFATLLASPSIDALVITTPPASHFEIARAALSAGKDVLVEKPLALTREHGEELVATVRRTGRLLMVGHILEYHPAIAKLREMVTSGTLGSIRYIYSNRLNHGTIRTVENILWSFAPHDISVILSLVGESPCRVAAHGGNYIHSHIADITVSAFEFASGMRAHIFVSWLHPYKEQRIIVVGSAGMAVFNEMKPKDKLVLYPHRVDYSNNIPVAESAEGIPVSFDTEEPLLLELQHFIACLKSRQSPRSDGHSGLAVLRVLEACQKSLETGGGPVSL